MRFKVEKLNITLECKIDDKRKVDDLVRELFSIGFESFTNIPGNYEYVRIMYNDSEVRVALVNKPEGHAEVLSAPRRINIREPQKIIRKLSSKPLQKFVSHCKLSLATQIPEDEELMNTHKVWSIISTLEKETGWLKWDGESINFDSDAPAVRLKLLFSTDKMVLNAGSNGRYRFRTILNYKGDNCCISLINKLAKDGMISKGYQFGKGEEDGAQLKL